MRRQDKQMSKENAIKALERGTWGVLSLCSDGIPYGVPVNYVYSSEENAVFFHCAPEGRKIDIINSNSNVSFAVVTREEIIPEKLTTLYESVILSGTASIVHNSEEKLKRFRQLCEALAPGTGSGEFSHACLSAAVVRIDIEEITGKSNI